MMHRMLLPGCRGRVVCRPWLCVWPQPQVAAGCQQQQAPGRAAAFTSTGTHLSTRKTPAAAAAVLCSATASGRSAG
jgi:hypothetical protein